MVRIFLFKPSLFTIILVHSLKNIQHQWHLPLNQT